MSSDQTRTGLNTRWMCSLVSLLGAFEVLMAVGSGSALMRVVGVAGGLALVAAPWVARRARGIALLLLVVGTVPFAALTVTSLVTPALAVLAWILAGLIHRGQARPGLPAPRVPLHPTHVPGAAST